MPRAVRISVEDVFEGVKDLDFFDENGALRKLSADVWDKASKQLGSKMSKKYVYLYLSRNDHGILSMLKKRHGIDSIPNNSIAKNERSRDSNWSMNASHDELDSLRTVIHISENNWNSMRPHNVTYADNREYRVLRPGWTDVLQEELWKQHRLPCCYRFQGGRVNDRTGEMFLNIKGACTECGAEINVYSLEKPADRGITLHVSTFDTKGVEHSKKRQLRGQTRRNVVKEAKALTTYGWRRNQANSLMNYGDVEPAHLYSEDVLRKAKQTETDRELGVGKVDDVVLSVRELKYRPEFVGTIRQIGLDKCFVMYWSLEQIDQYIKFYKQASLTDCRISIDATGSVVAQLTKPDGSTSPMFLYQSVISFGGKILPIFQMVSERHDANIITYWLREWLRSGAPTPREVVTDYSLALLNSVSLAFESRDLNEYANRCFELIRSPSTISESSCWIRIDIAHLIKLGARWKCYSKATAHVKEFYLRCLGLLTKCSTFHTFESLLRDTLTVAFSESESINSENETYNAQKRIINLIKTNENSEVYAVVKATVDQETERATKRKKQQKAKRGSKRNTRRRNRETSASSNELTDSDVDGLSENVSSRDSYSDDDDDDNNDVHQPDSDENDVDNEDIDTELKMNRNEARNASTIRAFMAAVKIDCQRNSKLGDRPNPYWCPKFADNLIRICLHFPLWTNLLRQYANPASSARSEEYFRQVKRFILNGGRNIRLDKFLIKHIRSLSGAVKLSEAEFQRDSSKSKKNSDEGKSVEKKAIPTTESITENEASNMSVDFVETEKQYLFEEEDWRGKNSEQQGYISKRKEKLEAEAAVEIKGEIGKKRDPKRGKYLTACPDIASILKRPRASTKLPLLRQGHLQPPCRVAGKTFRLRNTCGFDALAQSVLAAYSDRIDYHDHVENSKNTFFNFVKTLSISGLAAQTYNKRAVLLSAFFVVDNNEMNCHCNVSSLITHKLLVDEASYTITKSCLDCNSTSTETRPVVDVNVRPFYEGGLAALELAVAEKLLQGSGHACIQCQSKNINRNVTVGQHLFIDLECLQWSELAASTGYDNWEGMFTISQIPHQLKLGGGTYDIVSVIEYVGDSDPESVGHYIAHVRRITGKWEIFNNVGQARTAISATTRALLTKKKISLLMYIKATQ